MVLAPSLSGSQRDKDYPVNILLQDIPILPLSTSWALPSALEMLIISHHSPPSPVTTPSPYISNHPPSNFHPKHRGSTEKHSASNLIRLDDLIISAHLPPCLAQIRCRRTRRSRDECCDPFYVCFFCDTVPTDCCAHVRRWRQ